jgi:hypothetical protein
VRARRSPETPDSHRGTLLTQCDQFVLAGLVAHHSGADCIAEVRGLTGALSDFPDGPRPVADALAYADQTIGPDGQSMTLDQRFLEMLQGHGPDSPNAAAHPRRERRLREAVRRVDARLARLGRPSYAVARAWAPAASPTTCAASAST